MEPDLIAGLARLARREHLHVAALVRRASRRELEREGVLAAEPSSPVLRPEPDGRIKTRKRAAHVRKHANGPHHSVDGPTGVAVAGSCHSPPDKADDE